MALDAFHIPHDERHAVIYLDNTLIFQCLLLSKIYLMHYIKII